MVRIGIAVAVGALLAVGALVAVLSKHEDRLAGTNSLVEFSGAALPVEARGEYCAAAQHVPADATAVQVYAGTFGRQGGPVSISVRADGRTVSTGRAPGGYPDNTSLRVSVTRIRRNLYDATVCLRNRGTNRLQFAGNLTPQAGPKREGTEVIRLDWFLPGHPTAWSVSPRVARRFAVSKASFVGPWTLWMVFALIGAVGAGAVALAVRREP
jgi:hypothetical protein